MRPIPCFKQNRRPENVLTDGFATAGRGKYPVRDAIFSVGAGNESRVLSLMSALPVNAGTPASPRRMLSRCSKHPLDVPIDSPHHADARVHEQVAAFGGADQATDRCLPFLDILLSLGQACDVVADIAQTNQLAPTRQQDRIIERAGPGGSGLRSCDQLSAFKDVLRAQLAFSSAASIAALSEQIAVLS
jgi:hypothetical protein